MPELKVNYIGEPMDVPGEDPGLFVALLAPSTRGTVGTVLLGHVRR